MADYQVAVPSHSRAEACADKTLRLLSDRGVPPEQVRVFVTPGQEDDYRATCEGLCAEVVPGAFGLAAQRRAVTLYYPEGTHLVSCDDDLTELVRRRNDKETDPVADLDDLFREAFGLADQFGSKMWGIYPVLNPMFMGSGVHLGLWFLIGHLWGVVNNHDPALATQLANKEDYERCLRWYYGTGSLLRLDYVAAKTRMFAAGGLQAADQEDRAALNEREVDQLLAWWPNDIRVQKRTSKVGREIRFAR